ncbi:MAG: 3-deoxy-7-phosphoheptulonate synthase [Ruminococcaceae bacterium]|nr:3-deoxy-7-phosphoheptulonate synthase [Oscillospiraceae bacterium]
MQNNIKFIRKLPIPMDVKAQFPLKPEYVQKREERNREIADIFTGKDDRLVLVIGPCSADREDSVLDYITRLADIQEKVKDKIVIIPRIYTNKPRTTGDGYKGMVHQPNPDAAADMLEGIIAIRRLHTRAIEETGLFCADEMLYPENYRYLSDLLAYVAVGARSSENQQHRLTASGIDIPVGMKNPTGGDISVMLNSITAAQHSHTFLYRGWECVSSGNPLAHAILRGYVDQFGNSHPNYHHEDLMNLYKDYSSKNLQNMAVIIDTNHANSGKKWAEQPRICKDVLHTCRHYPEIKGLVKGFMIESYIEDGAQKIGEHIYGKSITDPCLGWEKTERLIFDIAELW